MIEKAMTQMAPPEKQNVEKNQVRDAANDRRIDLGRARDRLIG